MIYCLNQYYCINIRCASRSREFAALEQYSLPLDLRRGYRRLHLTHAFTQSSARCLSEAQSFIVSKLVGCLCILSCWHLRRWWRFGESVSKRRLNISDAVMTNEMCLVLKLNLWTKLYCGDGGVAAHKVHIKCQAIASFVFRWWLEGSDWNFFFGRIFTGAFDVLGLDFKSQLNLLQFSLSHLLPIPQTFSGRF